MSDPNKVEECFKAYLVQIPEPNNPTKEDGDSEIGNLRTPEQTESRQGSGTTVKSPRIAPSAEATA
jgi:hypothetical protein